MAGIRDGTIRNRSGERYKPSAIRGYERCLRLRIDPALGKRRLTEVRRVDVQDLIDRMLAEGVTANTVKRTRLTRCA